MVTLFQPLGNPFQNNASDDESGGVGGRRRRPSWGGFAPRSVQGVSLND